MEPAELLNSVAAQRAELRHGMGALEQALAAPAVRPTWAVRVYTALAELDHDLKVHVLVTEGEDGLYIRILKDAPRLAAAVHRLTTEHQTMRTQIDDLLRATMDGADVDVEGVRQAGTTLLALIAHHRQTGGDLLYEAYESDIGGET
ncbi:MAG TPA: hemerythrin domain-containing protein [Actinomycetes bacterium]